MQEERRGFMMKGRMGEGGRVIVVFLSLLSSSSLSQSKLQAAHLIFREAPSDKTVPLLDLREPICVK